MLKKLQMTDMANAHNAQCLDIKGLNCAASGTQPCCASCGCSLAFKTRSLSSSCPLGHGVH